MPEVGEEIVGAWLRYCAECDFVDYNVTLRDPAGEIDVIGVNLNEKIGYICEVATHTRGLGYERNKETILNKFMRAVNYGKTHLETLDFKLRFMFWAPVVRSGEQTTAIEEVRGAILERCDTDLELVVNESYLGKLDQLRKAASLQTRNSPHTVFRFLQIEESARTRASAS